MKRALIVLGALAVLAGLTWALWPSDESTPTVLGEAKPTKPVRSLAERLEEDEDRDDQSFDAGRGSLTGLVQNDDAEPVAGAEVTVFRSGAASIASETCPICSQPLLECGDPRTAIEVIEVLRAGKGSAKPIARAITAADGTFRIDSVPNEDLRVVASKDRLSGHDTYAPGSELVVVVSPRTPFLVNVRQASATPETEATPLAGVRVAALSADSLQWVEGTSDAQGEVRLDLEDEGDGVWVFAQAPGLLPFIGTLYNAVEGAEVLLERSRSLRVRTLVGGKPTEAVVTVSGGRRHPMKQKTQNGIALFDALGPEEYEAIAATETMVSPRQTTTLESEVTTIDFELRASARLMVTVIDEAGQPVENADVSVSGHDGDYRSQSTNQGDLVVLGPVGEGSLTVEVTGDDFRPWRRELDIHPGDNPLEVVLRKGVKLRGKVVDSEGKPVVQASIEAHAPVTSSTMGFTDSEGEFELTIDEPGPQELIAAHSTVGRAVLNVTAPADNLVIRLDPMARVRVFAHEGREAVPGAMVAVNEASGRGMNITAVTGDDGVVVISGLETGSYRVVVQSAEFRLPAPLEVTLTEGKVAALDVPMDRGLTVSGMVVDENGAGVGANVHTEPWTNNVRSEEDGKFTLTTLDPAVTYQVEAETDTARAGPVPMKGAVQGLRLVMKARPLITGRVVDQLTEQPLQHFTINSRQVDSPDGRFSEPANTVSGDTVMVEVAAEGFESVDWEGSLAASHDLGTVKLPKAKQIDGVVRDQRGNPVAGALVTCDSAGEEVTTSADGSFWLQLTHFEVGTTVSARRGQLKGSVALELGRSAEINLGAPTRVLGQVIDGDGKPVSGAISIRDAQGDDEVRVEAGPDGTFTTDLAGGRWLFITRLNASGQSFQVNGPLMRVVLGTPPGSCALSVNSPATPDELLLIPGETTPRADVPFEQLASLDGTVVFDTVNSTRVLRAAGFRCGTYTLFARWGSAQRSQRVDVRTGPNELMLPPPPVEPAGPEGGGP